MEWKKLSIAAIVVIAISIIVLMGIAVIDGYSEQLRTKTTGTNVTGLTIVAVNTSIDIGTAATYPYVYAITLCENSTGSDLSTGYTLTQGDENNAGSIVVDESYNGSVGTDLACVLSYKADSTAQAAADSFAQGMGIFGTFMAVLVLAIVGKYIISLFTRKEE